MKKLSIAVAIMMVVAAAFANGPDHGPGGPGDFGGGGVIVDSNGTAYVDVLTAAGTSTTAATFVLKAINSSGAIVWTSASISGEHHFELANSNLISVSTTRATTTTAASSTITALSTATGTTAWTLTFDGIATDIHPFSGGIYTVVVTPPATSGGTATRTLEAISNSGTVLWKQTI
jgi:hypothetical protein